MCSSTKRVCTTGEANARRMMARRNGMLVATPSTRKSASARPAFRTALWKELSLATTTFASSESNRVLTA